MGQPLYEVLRKYHFTFSFDSSLCMGPFNNYVTLFLVNFNPSPSLSQTVTFSRPPLRNYVTPNAPSPQQPPQTQCKIHSKVVSPQYSSSSTVALQSTSQPLKNVKSTMKQLLLFIRPNSSQMLCSCHHRNTDILTPVNKQITCLITIL